MTIALTDMGECGMFDLLRSCGIHAGSVPARVTADSHHIAWTDIVSPMVRTIVQLTEEQAALLDRAARRRGVSKAALVREALDAVFARAGDDAELERALRAAGSGASGVGDLAERHDDYLAERRPA